MIDCMPLHALHTAVSSIKDDGKRITGKWTKQQGWKKNDRTWCCAPMPVVFQLHNFSIISQYSFSTILPQNTLCALLLTTELC